MNNKLSKNKVYAEFMNAVTHGLGVCLSIIALIFLIKKSLSSPSFSMEELISYIIYGASAITLFLASTLYHSFIFSKLRDLFQKIDHASIYLLIAGTYTPYLMVIVGGRTGYSFLIALWAVAIAGIVFEVGWTNKFPKLSTILYLVMGWIGVFLIYPLYNNFHINGIILLFLGGLTYTIGTIFYKMKHNNWMHVIWHLFVIGGATFMYLSILIYV